MMEPKEETRRTKSPPQWLRDVAVVVLFLVGLLPFLPFRVDDAYISYVYARNLALGNGLTYNGAVVEGYSNLTWVLLISPFLRLGADPLIVARLASIVAGAGALIGASRLSAQAVRNSRSLAPFLATVCVAVLAPMSAWTLGGLETVFLSFLIVLLALNERGTVPKFPAASPILLLLISMTRPEGLLLFPIWVAQRAIRRTGSFRALAVEAAAFLIAYSLFLAWRWNTYGYLLPNTAFLKLSPSWSTMVEAAHWLLDFLALRPAFALPLVYGLVVSLSDQRHSGWRLALPLLTIAGFFAFVLFSGRDWMPHHRFLAPIAPLLAIPLAVALDAPQRWTRAAMGILCVAAIGSELAIANTLYRPLAIEFGEFTDGLVRAGRWLDGHRPPAATVAVVDSGALAYYGNRPTIDILGLNDEHIAHSPGKADVEYVLDQDPDVIQLQVIYGEDGKLLPRTAGDINQAFLENPRFQSCYTPDRPPDPYYPIFFHRVCDSLP